MPAIPILMYHNIARPPAGVRLRSLYLPPRRFAAQMRLLSLGGYRALSLRDALPYLQGKQEDKVVVLTFDDGYQDNVEEALPILERHGFTATCFVVSGALGGHNHWDAEQLGTRKAVMDRNALQAWVAAGMEVGAHTRAHPRLPQLPYPAAEAEIRGSKEDLENLLGQEVCTFAYPYGAMDIRERDLVQQSGFLAAVTTQRGRARVGQDLWALPRISVGGHHLPHVFPLQLWTGYEDRHRR
ncbi:MAG: polysaccharide deacetylase family protein [Acidithiobacillus sp.]|nr:polysaccharide deacetylase family protein [Acidithiobacillus sp.]